MKNYFIQSIAIILFGLAYTSHSVAQTADAEPFEAKLIQEVYEIPTAIWIQLTDSAKNNHQQLLDSIRKSDRDDIILLNYSVTQNTITGLATTSSFQSRMFGTEFFSFDDFIFPNIPNFTDESAGVVVARGETQGALNIKCEYMFPAEYLPTLAKGSKENLARSAIPSIPTVRNNCSLNLAVNRPTLISALPHAQFEHSRDRMVLTFLTLAAPVRDQPRPVERLNHTIESLLIRGDLSINADPQDLVQQSLQRPKSIVTSCYFLTHQEAASVESLTTISYPTDGKNEGMIVPHAIESHNCGLTIQSRMNSISTDAIKMGLKIDVMVAPPVLPKVPGNGNDLIDLRHQFYQARFLDESLSISPGKWIIAKKFAPHELELIKDDAYKVSSTQLDKEHEADRQSDYTLFVRVTPAEESVDSGEIDRLDATPVVESSDSQENHVDVSLAEAWKSQIWERQDLSAYDSVWNEISAEFPDTDETKAAFSELGAIRPYQSSFLSHSLKPITQREAEDLALKAGAEIADVNDPKLGDMLALQLWLRDTILNQSSIPQLLVQRGKGGTFAAIKCHESVKTEETDNDASEKKSHYLFRWAANEGEMHDAAKLSGQMIDSTSSLLEMTRFYVGEWEYASKEGDHYKSVLYPDGRADIWLNGERWMMQSIPVWQGVTWKIREDGALVIIKRTGELDAIFIPSPDHPNLLLNESDEVHQIPIPKMIKTVGSWVSPELPSREMP